jgi:uncharacterized glyoxalase superfamily protein PhnB
VKNSALTLSRKDVVIHARTYHQILGGTIVTLLKYGESPMATQVEQQWHDRIAHATLRLGELELTGVDLFPHDYRRPQVFFITLTISEPAKARQIFLSLSEGGWSACRSRQHFGRPVLVSS